MKTKQMTNYRWLAIGEEGFIIGEGDTAWAALQNAKLRSDCPPRLECIAYDADTHTLTSYGGTLQLTSLVQQCEDHINQAQNDEK